MTILNGTSSKPVLPMTQEKAKTWKDGSKYKDIKDKVTIDKNLTINGLIKVSKHFNL